MTSPPPLASPTLNELVQELHSLGGGIETRLEPIALSNLQPSSAARSPKPTRTTSLESWQISEFETTLEKIFEST